MRGAIVAAAVIAGVGLMACASGGPGEQLFKKRCGVCHPHARAEEKHMTVEDWTTTVARMRGHGAELTDQEAELVVRYLSTTYGR
jgi:mono/diheme cytochrome c family protein